MKPWNGQCVFKSSIKIHYLQFGEHGPSNFAHVQHNFNPDIVLKIRLADVNYPI